MRKIILLLIMVIQIIFICSCSGNQNLDNNELNNNSIKVYLGSDSSGYFVNKAIGVFEQEYPNIKLDKVYFDDRREYRNKLSTELMAGEGPDVVFLNSMTDTMSIHKAIDIGVFSDINTLIRKDKEFDISQYNKTIMESGVFNKKRYIIPIDYDVPVFLTTEEILKKNNIKIDINNWNMEKLRDIITQYNENIGDGQEKSFFSNFVSLQNLIQSSNMEFIDIDKKKVNINNPDFINILELFETSFNDFKSEPKYGEMMKAGDIIVDNSLFLINPNQLYKEQSNIKFYSEGTVRMFPFPTYEGTPKYTAYPINMAAIPNKCKNKEGAFNLIKIILSYEIQSSESLDVAPVNQKAFDNKINELSDESANKKFGDTALYSLNPKLVNDVKNIKENISKCIIPERDIQSFISRISEEDARNGFTLTKQEVVKELERKILLYMNE